MQSTKQYLWYYPFRQIYKVYEMLSHTYVDYFNFFSNDSKKNSYLQREVLRPGMVKAEVVETLLTFYY